MENKLQEQIEEIKVMVRNGYKPYYCGYTEFRSQGNNSDVFEDGVDRGTSDTLYEIGLILEMELESPEEPEEDY